MDYIERDLQKRLIAEFGGKRPSGVILAGIVGCGKTTLIGRALDELSKDYDTFTFTGDDIPLSGIMFPRRRPFPILNPTPWMAMIRSNLNPAK